MRYICQRWEWNLFSKGIVAYYFKTKKNLVLESLKEFWLPTNGKAAV